VLAFDWIAVCGEKLRVSALVLRRALEAAALEARFGALAVESGIRNELAADRVAPERAAALLRRAISPASCKETCAPEMTPFAVGSIAIRAQHILRRS